MLHTILNVAFCSHRSQRDPDDFTPISLYRKLPEHRSQHGDSGLHLHSPFRESSTGMQGADVGLNFSPGKLGIARRLLLPTDWRWAESFGTAKGCTIKEVTVPLMALTWWHVFTEQTLPWPISQGENPSLYLRALEPSSSQAHL